MSRSKPVDSPPQAPPLDTGGFLRWIWRQLTSMRTALVLLFALAVASVPGTVLPQRGTNPIEVNEWIAAQPTLGPFLDRIGMFDVFAAPWFAATYLLLFISLVGCVVPRLGDYWRQLRARPPRAPRFLDRMPEFTSASVQSRPSDALDAVQQYLKVSHWRVRRDEDEHSSWISAEKGYLREAGNLVFHFCLLLVLIAVAVSSLFGWRGSVIVVEGRGFSNTLTQYDAWAGGRLVSSQALTPFAFTLQSFVAEFEREWAQRGAPRKFEAFVDLQRTPTTGVETQLLRVNHPLVVDGSKIFLAGHGYAVQFVIRDYAGAVVFDDAVVFLPQDGNFTSTGVIKVPDSEPQLGFQGIFLPTSAIDDVRGPHSTFPDADDPEVFLSAWQGDLGLDSGLPQSIYRLVTDDMEQEGLAALKPGETWTFDSGSITFVDWRRWVSFQIAFDPGKEAALITAIIAILGLTVSLFTRRRRLWVRAIGQANGSTLVQIAGLGKSEASNVADDVDRAAAAVAGRVDDQ